MKNSLFCAILATAFFSANAQSGKNVEKGLFKINAFVPGVSYESGVGRNTTFNFDVAIIPMATSIDYPEIKFGILPGLQADFRYYNNMNRRLSKNKNIAGNSGNYVGVVNQCYLGYAIIGHSDLSSSFYYNFAFVYGIQRTRTKGFYWDIAFGPAIVFGDFDPNAGIFIDAKLGWVIRKRQ